MQVVVITGASDGIGAEMARQLAQRHGAGLALVLAARSLAGLQSTAEHCQGLGAQCLVVVTDVSVQEQCRALIAQAVERFGHIDTLVNNAGVSAHALLQDVAADDLQWYERLMQINLWGSVWCTHAALPYLKARKGRIVAVSSLAGLIGVPGRTAYSASKFAMTGFFEALRAELVHAGVSVTVAYPGVVLTQIRYHGYNAKGERAGHSGLREDGAMTVGHCVRLIVTGMQDRQREVVMTTTGKIGRFLKLIAPGLVERMAMNALKDEVKPR
ncbi:MAG: SDR family oxidoreductase [Betaproteobacteria bacterium]